MSAPINTTQSSKTAPGRKPRTCVLHLCPDLDQHDAARETVDLAIQTQRAGWRALIVSSGGQLVMESERAAVRHTRMPLDKRGLFAGWRNRVHLDALIARERPALLHAHGIETLATAYRICRGHRLPLVADLTQPLPHDASTRRLMSQLCTITSAVRVPSEYMGRELLDKFHLGAEQIYHIPPGIDLPLYDAAAISPERLQNLSRLWRLPEHAAVALMPMPLRAGLGHKTFLQALARMKNENIYAVIVGGDKKAPGLRAEFENMIHFYGLSGKVIMPDRCTDWPSACWLASVIVAPNPKPRGQHIELLAAQAIGRPVIVADSGANGEMVLSGKTAWLVPPGDVKALAEALREATQLDTDQRLKLAARTRQFIAENFPQVAWLTATMELYESLLRPSERTAKAKAA